MLFLVRPRLPGQAAACLQTVHAAHALAQLGVEVTIFADRGDSPATPGAALARFGLAPVPSLHLHIAPVRQRGLAGLWFRRAVARWWAGPPGVILARDLHRLHDCVARLGAGRHRVVVEVHGRASVWDPAGPQPCVGAERAVMAMADGVVANCEGTLSAWRADGALPDALPAVVAHNATSPARQRQGVVSDGIVRAVGSLRAYKGWAVLDAVAGVAPVEVVGEGGAASVGPVDPRVRMLPPVPHHAVPDLLARSAALVLPLADNPFGRHLTSPLKLWDYLATDVPLLLPDLPSVRAALARVGAPSYGIAWWTDASSLAASVGRILDQRGRAPVVRTWTTRRDELLPVLFGDSSTPASMR